MTATDTRIPLAQIFHVSDIHMADKNDQRSWFVRMFGHVPYFGKRALQGVSGHDNSAISAFEDVVSKSLPRGRSRGWAAPSWIVVTGDMSTWGDLASVKAAIGRIEGIARRLDVNLAYIYGNHDVWPERAPWSPLITLQELEDHRTKLRRRHFAAPWAHAPVVCAITGDQLKLPVPSAGLEVIFTSLNTIAHEQSLNVLANGFVREDLYWLPALGRINQLVELEGVAQAATNRQLRIVLTHHPVHDPKAPQRLVQGNELLNADHVAAVLRQKPAPSHSHVGTIVMSGHTHALFPELGQLPRHVARQPHHWHLPLEDGQLQLTVGTLAQRSAAGNRQTQEWQRLRFFRDRDVAGKLSLERVVYRRSSGIGKFRRVGPKPDKLAENVYF